MLINNGRRKPVVLGDQIDRLSRAIKIDEETPIGQLLRVDFYSAPMLKILPGNLTLAHTHSLTDLIA